MGTVKIQKKEYKGWKNCIEISNGIIDAIATTDVGPRIIRFGFLGNENEFCEVKDQVGTTGGDEWKIYGGHRLWHSPEHSIRTYEPDNSPVEWKKKKNGIKLIQKEEPLTKILKEMELTMSPDKAEVTLLHRLTNNGAWPIELSVWALSVMAPGGKEIIPQPIEEVVEPDFLPNRMISLWPYTRLNDPRVFWGEKYITLDQDMTKTNPFKFGTTNKDGWAAYANHGHLFVKRYNHINDLIYPDYCGSSYETYTIDWMLEMESLSPLVILKPGDSIEHTETWFLHDNVKVPKNEKEIDEIIIPLI